MTERKFYKQAYQLIFKEGKTHQEVYDQFVKETKLGPESVARTLSMVPSKRKHESLKSVLMLFIGLVIGIAAIRLVVMFSTDQLEVMNIWTMIFAVLMIVGAPALAIYGSFNGKVYMFGGASFFIVCGIIRGFFSTDLGTEATQYAIIGMGVIAFILSSILPLRLRVGYEQKLIDKEKEGKIVKRITYTFDDTKRVTRKQAFKENF